ncbi:hypothetical protein C7974DRAFT_431599 [Boeremia exigua]|uniref:uncharacterized protein n=1 Tax=Boeremia exigua TaxID=749465 RepID=UPI001E8D66A8|nr:uncharacterized protein C7974DRAFT_431599 [Boeremia exigua]KAH6638886.1 hypothetical protein C7974DRAFT_431599 [Boeremia exigua]
MFSIRRSCQSALRRSNGVVVCSNGSRRVFSRSVARSKGGLPVFLEPSSPELSTLLATINSKVLLPEHLTKEQEKLVFNEKASAKLETEPVEVTIGDVTLPLEYISRVTQPSRSRSLKEVVAQSETLEDWENVVRLLEGYHSAGIAVKPRIQEMVVRKLIENEHYNIVLKALQRVKATGLRLSTYNVTASVLKSAHDRAATSDWDAEETAKALRFARQIVDLMEEEEHHAVLSKGVKSTRSDWRSQPYVIAVPTELAAIIAQKHEGDVEIVKTLANRLVNALKQDAAAATPKSSPQQAGVRVQDSIDRVAALSTKTEADFKNGTAQGHAVFAYCQGLAEQLVVWNALRTSQAVLGAEMPLAPEAAEYEARTKKLLDESLEAMPRLRKRGADQIRTTYPVYLAEQLQKCQA